MTFCKLPSCIIAKNWNCTVRHHHNHWIIYHSRCFVKFQLKSERCRVKTIWEIWQNIPTKLQLQYLCRQLQVDCQSDFHFSCHNKKLYFDNAELEKQNMTKIFDWIFHPSTFFCFFLLITIRTSVLLNEQFWLTLIKYNYMIVTLVGM